MRVLRGRTDQAPAIACGDRLWSPSSSLAGYNCILAFTDKGTVGGSAVLYAYFKVGASGAIEFAPQPFVARVGSNTAGTPAAGFADGSMWLAWKSIAEPSIVEVYRTSSGYTWSSQGPFAAAEAIDPPTFYHDFGREFGVAWTTSN